MTPRIRTFSRLTVEGPEEKVVIPSVQTLPFPFYTGVGVSYSRCINRPLYGFTGRPGIGAVVGSS